MWAEHLVSERKILLSGEVYLRAGLFAAAARTFLSTNQSQLWMIAATQAKSSEAKKDDLIHLDPSELKLQAVKMAGIVFFTHPIQLLRVCISRFRRELYGFFYKKSQL